MAYDLLGKKYILTINVEKYDHLDDRLGSDQDEQNLIETFQDLV